MAAEPIPVGVRNRSFATPTPSVLSMEEATKAAEAARVGTKQMRTLELRKVCLAYAMKVAEKNETADAEQIVTDAARFYAFFGGDDE